MMITYVEVVTEPSDDLPSLARILYQYAFNQEGALSMISLVFNSVMKS